MAIPTMPETLPADVLCHGGPFTDADRDALPVGDHKVELIDGALIVSPSPWRAHNDALMHVFRQLDAVCPADVTIYPTAYDLRMQDGSRLVPDIMVSRTADLDEKGMSEIPLLVVEVLSPSSRLMDPLVKRVKYAEHGIGAYWIVEPKTPTLTVLELVDGSYVTRAVLDAPDDEVSLQQPYPLTVRLPR